MNKLGLFILFVLLIGFASAIKINEVEINPVDGSSGKEWIELYNDGGELDISLWELYDGMIGPKKIFTIPSGIILEEGGYYVVELDNTVLNNDGDFVSLYDKEGEEIDKMQMVKETKWGIETWQLCDGWKLVKPTKGAENNCDSEEKENADEEDEEPEEEIKKEEEKINEENNFTASEPENNVIDLTPKDIKTSGNVESSSKTKYVAYGFVLFCALLIVLWILKSFRDYKNEFRE